MKFFAAAVVVGLALSVYGLAPNISSEASALSRPAVDTSRQARAACWYRYQEAIRGATERRDSAAMNLLEYKLHSGEMARECNGAR